jgi:4-amino-4-deoxy-L-arabinose transferase-like glycosyltransferase
VKVGGNAAISGIEALAVEPARRWSTTKIALAVFAASALLRLLLSAWLPLLPDEAYYWEWSRHLAPGYFDHPPMIALLIRGGTAMFGARPLAIRSLPWVVGTVGTAAVLFAANALGGARAAARVAVIAAALPVASIGLIPATPDVPLFAFLALTTICVVHAVGQAPGTPRARIWWLLAGIALGAAFLSKYSAAVTAMGVFLALMFRRELRPHLLRPDPYLAVAVALVICAPMIGWNAQHHWISFLFQLNHGLGDAARRSPSASFSAVIVREASVVGALALLASPALFVLLVGAGRRGLRKDASHDAWLLAVVTTAWVVLFGVSALKHPIEANWPAPAFVTAAPLLGFQVAGGWRRRWFMPSCLIGLVTIAATLVIALIPVEVIPAPRNPVSRAFGWDVLAARTAERAKSLRATALEGQHNVWIAANRYQDASELGYHLDGHPTVFSLNIASRPNEFDQWPGFAQRARPADDLVLILDDGPAGQAILARVATFFETPLVCEPVALRRTAGGSPISRRVLCSLGRWSGRWR